AGKVDSACLGESQTILNLQLTVTSYFFLGCQYFFDMTTTDSASGSTKKQYYDNDYFDTDEEISDNETSMAVDDSENKDRRKLREIQSNDDLLYDPEDDDANEDWVGEQLRAIAPSKNGTPSKQMAKTDAILTCPLCFTPVCLSCQRHELYPNQYRAMFVTNCRPNFAERFRYRESNNANNIPEEAKGKDVYYPVNCDICKTHIAMFDDEEVYHFFNVIAS
ncbi:hypothetical protein INT43_000821, partial [Umbelopsis isabellina]